MNARVLGCSLSILLMTASAAYALDPSQPLTHYGRMLWSQDRGLPAGPVFALAQDSDGYLWLGTDRGLIRFDGTDFTLWDVPGEMALPRSRAYAIVPARDGSMWIAYAGGEVSRIHRGTVTTYSTREGLPVGYLLSMFEHTDGSIWIGGQSGVLRLNAGRWERVGDAEGLPDAPASMIDQDIQGTVWVSTSSGTFRRRANATRFEQVTPTITSHFTTDEDGTVWLTDAAEGLRRLDASGASSVAGLRTSNGRRLFRDRHGMLWLGTRGSGLWRLRTGSRGVIEAAAVTGDDGAEHEEIWDILEDRDGNMWLGTGRGLLRLSDNDVTMITRREGLEGRSPRAVAVTPDGRVWVGTSEGLYTVDEPVPGRFEVSRAKPGNITSLHVDPSGRLWVAAGRHVGTFENGEFHPLPIPPEAIVSPVHALATDAFGGVWLCTFFQGALRWKDDRLDHFASTATGRRPCGSAQVDADGRLWLGFRAGGAAMYDSRGELQVFDASQGVPGRGGNTTVYGGRGGVMWLTTNEGLIRYENGRFSTVAERSHFPGELRAGMVEDGDGMLWVAVSLGLLRLDPSDAGGGRHRSRLFDASDGLSGSVAPVVEGSPTAARSPDGRLWFATDNGLAVINPRKLRGYRPPAVPRIESVVADDQRHPPGPEVTLRPGTSRLEVHYASLNLSGPKNLRFRYKLEGFDRDWVDAGTRRQAFYTNLPPRDYRFLVMASDNEGRWTEKATTIPIELLPRFYQTQWFLGACALMVTLLVAGAWWLRLRVVHNRFATILAERARVGREIHDTLLQSLGSVSLELEVVASELRSDADSALESLKRLRGQVTQCIREARETIWDLRSQTQERVDLVTALRQLGERMTGGKGIQFTLTVTGRQRPSTASVQEQLLRIAQEAMTNALRHGHPRHLTIELDYQLDSIFLRVSDDGRGFDTSDGLREQTGHWGVISMRERAAAIGGSFTIASRLGCGTQVETVVPLSAES